MSEVGRPGLAPFWLSAFLDLAGPDVDRGTAFWEAVTGFARSAPRGAYGEFATLVPPDGDDYLRVQRLGEGASRLHLDVHVRDPAAAADRAAALGAEVVDRHRSGFVVLRSPGGLPVCLVRHPAGVRPTPVGWPGGHRSGVYQVCLDLPPSVHDVEAAFWAGLLGGRLERLGYRTEFTRLLPMRRWALEVLLQRLDTGADGTRAHLDLGSTDRAAEVPRHLALGAEPVAEAEFWTVLRDPAGLPYCVTDRDPATLRLPR